MHTIFNSWEQYTQEVLAWEVDKHKPPMPFASTPSLLAQQQANRLMAQGQRRKIHWYILLGCETKGMCLALSQELMNAKNDSTILIIEHNVNKARDFLKAYSPLPHNIKLLVDSSPWALYLLTLEQLSYDAAPLNSASSIIHWTMPPAERSKTLTTWRKLFLGAEQFQIPQKPAQNFKLSVGAILHPQEAHLEDFFAHIPHWVHEVVIVWDGEEPPAIAQQYTNNIKHFARPLASDFSAQRNTLLSHCTGNWLLYLDADERLNYDDFKQLEYIAQLHDSLELAGVYFPRITFEGDENHVRMGHGLWPDIQLRFFPLNSSVHFVGSVHERVEGICGKLFLAPHISLVHFSHIYKNEQELRQRLAVFNAAGNVEHKLSGAYPRLPNNFFNIWTKDKSSLFQLPS